MEGQTVAERAKRKGWIEPKEAARRSGFALPTIYRWRAEGAIECENIAGRVFIRLASLKKKLGKLGKELLED